METTKENFIQPLITSHFEKCRVPFSSIPQEVLHCHKEISDAKASLESKSVEKVDLRNLPQLRISLERICFSVNNAPKTRNLSIYKNFLNRSESDDSSETIVINGVDDDDEVLAVNRNMERMEVESEEDSCGYNMVTIASENSKESSEDTPKIFDVSKISVCLEKITLPLPKEYIKEGEDENVCQSEDEDEYVFPSEDEHEQRETDELEIENKLEKMEGMESSLRTCYVALERINIETVSPRNNDLSSPATTSKTSYGNHLPEAVIRLEKIPASVFRKYGIAIPEHYSPQRNRQQREPLYCVLGIKLLFQKRKQESLFEQRVSEIRDFIIPGRNSIKKQLSAKRRVKRLQRNLIGKTLSFDDDGVQMTKSYYTTTP